MAIFCFTDIEGSTEKWEKHRDVMGQVIARHNQILEQNVARFGGQVIKHTGDGIYAIFDGPEERAAEALGCALAVQREVQDETWPGIGELRIRMAFHCGQAEKLGGDYFGPVANRTARLLSLGWGGQVLVSEDLKKLGALPEGASLQDMGVHQVKDLPEPQQVYGLLHPDLNLKEFPALKSLSRPHNLPPQLTPFIDRQKELSSIAEFFKAPSQRLLTLRGSGGTGKSRLAIQAGMEALKQFRHGVYFVGLESLPAPEGIVDAIAAALRLPLYGNEAPKAQLLAYLRERDMLLILDHFDHLLSGVPLLSELLLAAPQLKILATSRAKLNHNSESVLEIQGLDTPGAIQLFMQRARKVKADFTAGPEDQELLVRICRQVEGMPLGLELAAAWAKTLPLKEICRRLESSIALLISSDKDLPERQRSMRALFDYSWKLLSLDEQKMFRNLSVFIDGFSGAAAEAVAQCNHAGLSVLVNKSLLRMGEDGRYFVHETLRQFAQAKLDVLAPEKLRIAELHAQFYFQFLKSKEAALKGEGQLQGMADLALDFGNVRRAWKFAAEKGKSKLLGQGARALALYAETAGLCGEWLPLFEKAAAAESGPGEDAARAAALLGTVTAEWRHDAGLATAQDTVKALEKSVQAFKRLNAKDEAAFCLLRLCAHGIAEGAKAVSLTEAASIFRLAGDRNGEAMAKAALGYHLWSLNQNPEGKRMLGECQGILKELGNLSGEAAAWMDIGSMALQEGDTPAGIQAFRRAKELFITLGGHEQAGWAMARLADFFVGEGAWAEALPFAEEALGVFESRRHERGMQACGKSLSAIYWALGDMAKALALADRALARLDPLKEGDAQKAGLFLDKAEALQRQGGLEEALALAGEGQRMMQGAADRPGAARAFELQGDICMEMGNAARAREGFKAAHLEYGQAGPEWRGMKAWTLCKMAGAESLLGQAGDARRNYVRVLAAADLNSPEDAALSALKGLASVLAKEKKQLEALRLLCMAERLLKDPKLAVSCPRAHMNSRAESAALLAELSSKLFPNVVDEAKAWAKGMPLGAFYKETIAKYNA
jgi:predicted ATPase/class 3 adenylate cyclase